MEKINEQVIDSSETYSSLDGMKEKLTNDNKILKDRKDKMVDRLDQLKSQYDDACRDMTLDIDAKPDDDLWRNRLGMTKSEFEECIDALSEHIGMLNRTIKSNNDTINKIPYLKKMDTPEFTNYIKNYKIDWQDEVDYEDVYNYYITGNHDLKLYQKLDGKEVDWVAVVEYMLSKDENLVIDEHQSLRDSYLKYEAMTEQQRLMYHYLFKTEGQSEAEHYLNDIIGDEVRRNRGLYRAERRIKKMASSYSVDKDGHITQATIDTTLTNLIGAYGSGFEDAIKGNYTGLFKADKDDYTEEEYEQIFMLQYLEQNGMLKGAYDSGTVGGTVSNMFMSMIMYTGVTYLSGGTALAGIVPYLYQAGNIATSVANTTGNARHYALVNGASEEEADQYSSAIMRNNLVTQVTSAVVSRGIGATTQYAATLNGTNTLSLPTNVVISATNTVIGATTATWEVGQEAELKSALLHEKPLDLSTATDQMVETFVSNIIMGGLSEIPGLALCKYSMQWDGKVFEFDTEDCLAFFRDNPNATAQDFVKSYSGNAVIDPSNGKTIRFDEHGDAYYTSPKPGDLRKNFNFNNWLKNVNNTKYQKTVDGITFVSLTESGLERLVQYYNNAKKNTTKSADYFLDKVSNTGLIVTDIIEEQNGPSFRFGNVVYLNNYAIDNNQYSVFYHEVGHYYDGYIEMDRFKFSFESCIQTMKGMDRSALKIDEFKRAYVKAGNDFFDENYSYFVRDFSSKYPGYDNMSDEAQNKVWRDYVRKQKNKYLEASGYAAISDILDAVTNGELHSSGYMGHGDEYYNRNSDLAYKEVLANISDLYNNGNVDLLYKYLPEEVCRDLIGSFENMVGITSIDVVAAFRGGDGRQTSIHIDSIVDYLDNGNPNVFPEEKGYRNHITGFSKETLIGYLSSFTCCADYFNLSQDRIDSKYGSGSFKKFLTDYYNTQDINSIPDKNLQNFVKYVDRDRISMYLDGILDY